MNNIIFHKKKQVKNTILTCFKLSLVGYYTGYNTKDFYNLKLYLESLELKILVVPAKELQGISEVFVGSVVFILGNNNHLFFTNYMNILVKLEQEFGILLFGGFVENYFLTKEQMLFLSKHNIHWLNMQFWVCRNNFIYICYLAGFLRSICNIKNKMIIKKINGNN